MSSASTATGRADADDPINVTDVSNVAMVSLRDCGKDILATECIGNDQAW
jgi:hypothetical protein